MASPNRPLVEASYNANLWWAYLIEQYGTSAPDDPVEAGMNLIAEFWKQSKADPAQDGITILNKTLEDMGYEQRFRDVWKDFAVASYAKHLGGLNVPDKYQYEDMAQPGGDYPEVSLTIDQELSLDEAVFVDGQAVSNWGANYYELRPAADVPLLDIQVIEESGNPLYYTILGIKDDDLVYEHNRESRHLSFNLENDAYDKVAIIEEKLYCCFK